MRATLDKWFSPDARVIIKSSRSLEFFIYSILPVVLFGLLIAFLSNREEDVLLIRQYNSTTCEIEPECSNLVVDNIECSVDKITYPDGSVYRSGFMGSGVYMIDTFQDKCITFKLFDSYSSCYCTTQNWGKRELFTRNTTHVFALQNPNFVDDLTGAPEANGYSASGNSFTLGSLSIYVDVVQLLCYGSISFYIKMEPSVVITPVTNKSLGTYVFYKRDCERSCTFDSVHTKFQLTNIGSLCLIQYTCKVKPFNYVKSVKQRIRLLTTITESFSITLTALGVLSMVKLIRQPEIKMDDGPKSVSLVSLSTAENPESQIK